MSKEISSGVWRDPDGHLWRVKRRGGAWWIREVEHASVEPAIYAFAPQAWLRTFLSGCERVQGA